MYWLVLINRVSVIAEPERVIKFRVQYPTFGENGAELHTTTGKEFLLRPCNGAEINQESNHYWSER